MFMNKIKLHIDERNFENKPKEEIGIIKPRLQSEKNIKEIEIKDLPNIICSGYTISPAVMNGGCKSCNWKEQQLFMVDIDNNDINIPLLTIQRALDICKGNNLNPSFYYYTFSHTEEKPKYRICFIFDEVIDDLNKRKIIMETLVELFPQSDKSAKNPDRIFFGTNKQYQEINFNNRINFDDIIKNYENIKNNYAPKYDNNTELEDLKKQFDFFEFLKQRNGEPIYSNENYAKFYNCELCGHKEDLVYYFNTKTFMCFSASLNKGGSIIDYLMILYNFSVKQAIEYFKYDLLGLKKNELYKFNEEILANFKKLKIENNISLDEKSFSKLFADTYKDTNKFNVTLNEWMYYDGKIWIEDTKSMNISSKAEEFYDNLKIYANSIENDDIKEKFLKYISKFGHYSNRVNLICDSKNIYYISHNDLDNNDDLFNCQNGTLNLKTLEFKQHNSNDMLTKISNVVYNPSAKATRFTEFLDEVFENNKELIDYIQKILGYSLTTNTFLEECYILIGTTTRNGKSTLVETIAYMLGNSKGYAMNIMPESLAIKFNKDSRIASGDIARLNNCRFVTTSEPPKNMLIDNALLKNITGRDRITARQLHQKEIEFCPKFKIFINTNHFPIISDNSVFESNRIKVIEFNRHFSIDEQDVHLKEKLKEETEISGIFNWCLDGLKKFNESNKYIIPQCVIDATNKYKDKSDKINEYITACLEKSNTHLKVKDVYDDYIKWCNNMNIAYEKKSEFIEYFKKKNLYSKSGTINGKTEKNILCNYSFKK